MAFGFNSSLGARLQAMGGFPPAANYLPAGEGAQSAPKPMAAAPPPGNAPSSPTGPNMVPAGASFGPGYIPGIYSNTPGMVAADAAPAATAVGDAAGGAAAGADAAGAGAAGGSGVLSLLMHLFGA